MSKSHKVVVVTGASQGIGAAVVKAFRKLDYRIVATARSIKPSDDANVLAVAGDIGDPATARRVISEGVARFGRIDTLVNNAGIYIGKPFTEHSAEDYAAVMNVNVAGFFHVTQLAIAEMEKHSSGHVVNVTASIDHAISGAYSVLAALTKGGLNAATRSLAIEYAKKGIRVNAVAPGVIKTPMHAPETHEMLGTFHPVGRMGETTDIADAILFLDSAPFITGEVLHVDGGQNAGH
jgi:NAD(P)-dependent dehydrogenase (short-subunit alcohol dehydrogenase family)